MKAAIYARVSKERCKAAGCGHVYDEHRGGKGKCGHGACKCKAYSGQDPENQLAELRSYAERQGWEVVEYVDRAKGWTSDRDAFKELFADASRRKFDVVLVWALDRLSREGILETFQHLRGLKAYGVQFESYSEPQFRTTGPFGEMFAELMVALAAWMAEQEHIRISERTKAGLARARAEGRVGGRPAVVFDRYKALEMRAQKPPVSWRAIARKMGVAQSSIRAALANMPARGPKRGVQKTPSQKHLKNVRNRK